MSFSLIRSRTGSISLRPSVSKEFFLNRRNLFYIRSLGDISFHCHNTYGTVRSAGCLQEYLSFPSLGDMVDRRSAKLVHSGQILVRHLSFSRHWSLLQKMNLSLNLEPSPFVRKYSLHFSVFLFAAIIWSESVTKHEELAMGTSFLLLSILLAPRYSERFYKGQAWCRHLCPLGKIIGAAATISDDRAEAGPWQVQDLQDLFMQKGSDDAPGCPVYLGAFNIRNNVDCLMCGRCVSLCDKDSPSLRLRNPFVELILNKGRYITCS